MVVIEPTAQPIATSSMCGFHLLQITALAFFDLLTHIRLRWTSTNQWTGEKSVLRSAAQSRPSRSNAATRFRCSLTRRALDIMSSCASAKHSSRMSRSMHP